MKKGNIFRGLALIILGILILYTHSGCHAAKRKDIPDVGERIVFSDTRYRMVQGQAVHRNADVKGREFIFIPLTLRNGSGAGIIFSTRVCVTAYALPSGEKLIHSHDAVMYGKDHIRGFRLFDGILYAGRDSEGWLAFDLPEGTESVHIDFSTGIREGETFSFDCKI